MVCGILPARGRNQCGIRQFAPQRVHGGLDEVRLVACLGRPQRFQQFTGAGPAAVSPQQFLQERVFARGEVKRLAVGIGKTPDGIDRQAAVGEHGGRTVRIPAAQKRADPGEQLGIGERLGQVVVGAEIETLDTVFDTACGGEHQRAHGYAQPVDGAHDLVAGQHGQVAVEKHHVECPLRKLVQGLDARIGRGGRISFMPETVVQHRRQVGIILDDQDSRHCASGSM